MIVSDATLSLSCILLSLELDPDALKHWYPRSMWEFLGKMTLFEEERASYMKDCPWNPDCGGGTFWLAAFID